MHHVRQFLYQSGGVRLTPQQRSERQLTGGEREEISRGIAAGESARQLAKLLGRSPSTVSREIARNGGRDRYRATPAEAAAYARGRAGPSGPSSPNGPLYAPWWRPSWLCAGRPSRSQDGCAARSPVTPPYRSRTKRSTSRSTTLAGRQAIDRSLTQRLRSARPMRRPKLARRPPGRGIIRGMVSISDRPAEVEDRKVPGHWEGDLVMGTRPSAVATLVERTSRYTTIVALPDGIKAEQVTPYLTRSLLSIPPQLRRTLTWDRAGR
ncbi:IS30 family transposase [Streptomyces sp. NPDC056682]|uniref:IS30 family transposase n=1 Tax=Streptomyces sp. NPDC056682 TaxID=3345909 RepID=UPI0036CCADB3